MRKPQHQHVLEIIRTNKKARLIIISIILAISCILLILTVVFSAKEKSNTEPRGNGYSIVPPVSYPNGISSFSLQEVMADLSGPIPPTVEWITEFYVKKTFEKRDDARRYMNMYTINTYDVDASEAAFFIGDYYRDISDKNYEAAFLVGAQGRSYEEFVNLYDDTSRIFYGSLKEVIIDKEYLLQVSVIHNDNALSVYEVDMQLDKKSDGSYSIAASSVTELQGPWMTECVTFPSEYDVTQEEEYCRNFISSTINWYHNSTMQAAPSGWTEKGKENTTELYILERNGAAALIVTPVYTVTVTTGTISYYDTFVFRGYIPSDGGGNLPECFTMYPMHELSSYSTECYAPYQNEEWFRENVKALEASPIYLSD